MKQTFRLRLTILAICTANFAGISMAEPCTENSFSRANSKLYNSAYTALVEQQNPDAATDKLAKLTRKRNLSCYERGTALRLSAEIKRAQDDSSGAIADLESLIAQELGDSQLLLDTRRTVFQIYTQLGDYNAAADNAENWIVQDGQPEGNDALHLAALFFETGRIDSAIADANHKLEAASLANKAPFYYYLYNLHKISSDIDGLINTLDQFEAFLSTAQLSVHELSNSWGLLVYSYSDINQHNAALDIMNMRVDRGDILRPRDWSTLAHLNYDTGNFAKAVEWGEKLRATDGKHADITLHALLHLSYAELGDTEASTEFGNKLSTDQLAADIINLEWDSTESDVSPIGPPSPSYPSAALTRGVEGECLVFFDVDSVGVPFNVDAECSDRRFRSESIRSVSETKFSPKIADGLPRNRRNVVYPLVFSLDP